MEGIFTKITSIMEKTFKGETTEVGLYLTMARKAELEGYPDIAMYLKNLAWEEAGHACEVLTILGKYGGMEIKSTKENLQMMLEGEKMATQEKLDAAMIARDEGVPDAALFFESASKDEHRHRSALEGFLKKL
ncbi:rubrerythrin family protein [Methanocella sp. CWC-04]|uniref:Rubrerythrin family protein n=1 Tax=Methanooceanicella nereidis TaxID=2052831 RepID=A0AAP2REY0_9EURY|nr:ferritin family protein [Methanocella sp. CWC-04]MCD1296093.1 rubrerythrin family protein [Methanocella sp. CWC-04]